jgi:hypothetical protein
MTTKKVCYDLFLSHFSIQFSAGAHSPPLDPPLLFRLLKFMKLPH